MMDLVGADVVGPTGREHEEHLTTLRFGESFDCRTPTVGIPGVFLKNGVDASYSFWVQRLKVPVRYCAGDHVAGDVPAPGISLLNENGNQHRQHQECFDRLSFTRQ